MNQPRTFTLTVRCPRCERPFCVEVQITRRFSLTSATEKMINCPYDACGGYLAPKLPGDILAVWHNLSAKPADTSRVH